MYYWQLGNTIYAFSDIKLSLHDQWSHSATENPLKKVPLFDVLTDGRCKFAALLKYSIDLNIEVESFPV